MNKLLECPQVIENNQIIGYGGDQDWFHDKWAIKAGCASVSAANMLLFYQNKQKTFTKKEYLKVMEEMFEIMMPGKRGFPYVYLYARRLNELLKMQYTIIRNPYPDKAIEFVKEAIDHNHPIGLLILTHRRRKVRDDLWHWVTIFGYQDNKHDLDIIFSDCGIKKSIPARILFERHRKNVIKMVKFY